MSPTGSTSAVIAREIRHWQEHLASLRRSPKTISTYGAALQQLGKFLLRRRVKRAAEVAPRHLEAWRTQLVADGCQAATVDVFLRAAKGWFRWLTQTGQIFWNPAADIELPRIPKSMGRFPSEDQMKQLLQSVEGGALLDLRDRALLEIAYSSAARLSELAALDVGSVDWANGLLRIRGKGDRERMVPLTRAALGALSRYLTEAYPRLRRSGETQALFLSQRGGRRLGSAGVAVVIRRRAASAGFELAPHGIRRAVATHLVRRGAPVYQVKELLGHQSFRHLSRYSLPQTANVQNLLWHSRLNR